MRLLTEFYHSPGPSIGKLNRELSNIVNRDWVQVPVHSSDSGLGSGGIRIKGYSLGHQFIFFRRCSAFMLNLEILKRITGGRA